MGGEWEGGEGRGRGGSDGRKRREVGGERLHSGEVACATPSPRALARALAHGFGQAGREPTHLQPLDLVARGGGGLEARALDLDAVRARGLGLARRVLLREARDGRLVRLTHLRDLAVVALLELGDNGVDAVRLLRLRQQRAVLRLELAQALVLVAQRRRLAARQRQLPLQLRGGGGLLARARALGVEHGEGLHGRGEGRQGA